MLGPALEAINVNRKSRRFHNTWVLGLLQKGSTFVFDQSKRLLMLTNVLVHCNDELKLIMTGCISSWCRCSLITYNDRRKWKSDLFCLHQEIPCYHKCINGSFRNGLSRNLLAFKHTQLERMSYQNKWVVFYGDHGWLSRHSVAILYWKNCLWVTWEFHLFFVTFGGLSLMQILNCEWGVVACAKIVQICLRLEHYIHGNGQEGLDSECTWIMQTRSRASGFWWL